MRDDYETLQQEFKYKDGQLQAGTEALMAEKKRLQETETKLVSCLERVDSQEETIRKQGQVHCSFSLSLSHTHSLSPLWPCGVPPCAH